MSNSLCVFKTLNRSISQMIKNTVERALRYAAQNLNYYQTTQHRDLSKCSLYLHFKPSPATPSYTLVTTSYILWQLHRLFHCAVLTVDAGTPR